MRPRVTTLFELVDESAAADPDAEALVFADGERLTVGALAERSVRHAAALLALGVTAGDRVGLPLPASADLVALLLAVTRVGAVAVPVNARYRPDEVRHVVVHSGAALVVTAAACRGWPAPGAPDLADLAQSAVESGPTPELRGLVTLADLAGGEAADVARAEAGTRVRDPAVLVYTSGTDARRSAKGCVYAHGGMTAQAFGYAHALGLKPEDDRYWTPLPLFHVSAIVCTVAATTSRRRAPSATSAAGSSPRLRSPSSRRERGTAASRRSRRSGCRC